MDYKSLAQLSERIHKLFSYSELKELCFTLNLDIEDIEGESKKIKVMNIVLYFERRQRVDELIKYLQKVRPAENWNMQVELFPSVRNNDKISFTWIRNIIRFLHIEDYLLISTSLLVLVLSIIVSLNSQESAPILLLFSTTILIFLVITHYVAGANQKRIHTFQLGSLNEAQFFAKWYSQNGDLHIFCSDLRWIEEDGFANVKQALIKKAKRDELVVYIRQINDQVVKELVDIGAVVLHVRDEVRSIHRFSIRINEGISTIILRNKDLENPNRIRIEEIFNRASLINLALDMLDDCYDYILAKIE